MWRVPIRLRSYSRPKRSILNIYTLELLKSVQETIKQQRARRKRLKDQVTVLFDAFCSLHRYFNITYAYHGLRRPRRSFSFEWNCRMLLNYCITILLTVSDTLVKANVWSAMSRLQMVV